MPSDPLPKRPIFTVLYGLPGVGKTTVSFTAGNVLHQDFDRGVGRAVQANRPISIEPEDWGSFKQWMFSQEAADFIKDHAIETVVVDTVGTLLEDYATLSLVRANVKNNNGAGGLSLQGWGALGAEFNLFKARLQELGVHLVAICHAKEVDDDGKKMRLAVKGSSADILYRNADLIGYCYVHDGNRVIQFAPTEYCIGKDTGHINRVVVPNATDPEFKGFFMDIIRKTQEFMTEESAAQVKMREEIEQWTEDLHSRKTAAEVTVYVKMMQELSDKVLRDHLKPILLAYAEANGMTWDKDAGAYKGGPESEEKAAKNGKKVSTAKSKEHEPEKAGAENQPVGA